VILERGEKTFCYQARPEQLICSTLAVKIRYANFDTENLQKKVTYIMCDHILGKLGLELSTNYTTNMHYSFGWSHIYRFSPWYLSDAVFEDTEEVLALYQALNKMKNATASNSVGREIPY
jgi:DNA polymerase-4